MLFLLSRVIQEVKLSLYLCSDPAMGAYYGKMEVQTYPSLALLLMEVSSQFYAPTALTPRNEPLVPVGWEAGKGLRAGLDAMKER